MRRGLSWLAASVALGYGSLTATAHTFAPFTDIATATGAILTGTIDLLLSDNDEPFKDNLTTHTWVLTDALPGEGPVCESFQLANAGTRNSLKITIKVVNFGTGGTAIAQEVIFDTFTYGADDLLPHLNALLDGHDGKSVRDLEMDVDGITLTKALFANHGNSNSVGACLSFHGDAPNSLQGLSWLGTFIVTISSS